MPDPENGGLHLCYLRYHNKTNSYFIPKFTLKREATCHRLIKEVWTVTGRIQVVIEFGARNRKEYLRIRFRFELSLFIFSFSILVLNMEIYSLLILVWVSNIGVYFFRFNFGLKYKYLFFSNFDFSLKCGIVFFDFDFDFIYRCFIFLISNLVKNNCIHSFLVFIPEIIFF